MAFELPPLPYPKDALAPHMSEQTLNFHHGKHHQTYVNNLNGLVDGSENADKSLEDAVLQARLDGQEKYDIQSTPSFIIDGKTYAGDQSVDKFAAIIDPLLSQ